MGAQLPYVLQETERLHFVLEIEVKCEAYENCFPMMIAYMHLVIALKTQGLAEDKINKLLKMNNVHSYCMPFFEGSEKNTIVGIFLKKVALDIQIDVDVVFPLLFKLIEASLLKAQDAFFLEAKGEPFFFYLIDHLDSEKLARVNESLNDEQSLMSLLLNTNTLATEKQKQAITERIKEKIKEKTEANRGAQAALATKKPFTI